MNFYSTYYKNMANYGQVKELKDKFDSLDINGDNALNKDELANIFVNQNLTEEDKQLLILGVDNNDDNFLTYTEFTPAFLEFDVDGDAEISSDESDFAKKKIEELKKQMQIDEQYDILKNLSSSDEEKQQARDNIEVFNAQRKVIYLELDVSKKDILISHKELKIQEIQDYIDENDLLEFDEANKLKEIEYLNIKKDLLLLDKDLAVNKLTIESLNLNIVEKIQQKRDETDPGIIAQIENELSILGQEKISAESELIISVKNLEIHHNDVKIKTKQDLLKKFFVPEFIKDRARKDLEKLYDKSQITNQQIELHEGVSSLSLTRAQLLDLIYQYEQTGDPAIYDQIQILDAQEEVQQLNAQIASLKVELLDKRILLKNVLPKSNHSPFDQMKIDLETEITDLEAQIAAIEAQLA